MEEGYDIEDVVCIAESDKAIRVTGGDLGDDKPWIPQSQITSDSEVWKKGQEGVLSVTEWWARKQGWL